ncbi:MAG: alpha/beta hydrolase [Chloroflexi bacterium]|nr:alpha/beta hydrolase [Chloroflexota bacterium]
MTKSNFPFSLSPIPYVDHSGKGQPLHFLHANGYPPACYRPFLENLTTQYHVFGMLLRPLWPKSNPEEIENWTPFTNDLLQFFDERKFGPVIGMGHSIGAIVTLRAALREPERFRALVLMDPVLFPRYFMLEWNLMRMLGLGYRLHPLINGAVKRRREFDNLDKVFEGYRRRDIFRFFSDENLRTFIKGITKPKPDGGYELAYSPEWEARVYYTGIWRDWDLWDGLKRLDLPTLIIRGAETDTFWASTASSVQRLNRRIRIVALEKSTHLLPLERPQEVFEIAQSFLKEIA